MGDQNIENVIVSRSGNSFVIKDLSKYIDRLDAEKFLTNLPIKFQMREIFSADGAQVDVPLNVYINEQGVRIFPPLGIALSGFTFEQEGPAGDIARKIKVVAVAEFMFETSIKREFANSVSTFSTTPANLGCTGWVGLYQFQREQDSLNCTQIRIYHFHNNQPE